MLVLDEPGNHLDVETVDALAQALSDYRGTVIFTSHDRSFVEAVATGVVEVGAGRVVHHGGSYAEYLARVTREIDAAEEGEGRAAKAAVGKGGGRPGGGKNASGPAAGRDQRDLRREIGALERTMQRLDAEKRSAEQALLAATDPAEAMRLHAAMTAAADRLAAAEERWLGLQERGAEGG